MKPMWVAAISGKHWVRAANTRMLVGSGFWKKKGGVEGGRNLGWQAMGQEFCEKLLLG